MKYLVRGMESKEKIKLLLTMTKIDRDDLISALIDHFCNDFKVSDAASINNVKQPNMVDPISKLNEVAEFAENYFEYKMRFKEKHTT